MASKQDKIMNGICRLIFIDAKSILKEDWVVFKRYNQIYKATRTESDGEFLISHITNKCEWRYIHPDDPSRKDWDKFQQVVIEASDKTIYPVYFSEWQVILNCLLDKEVEYKLTFDFDFNQYATITKIV